jgi:hypothetical protein
MDVKEDGTIMHLTMLKQPHSPLMLNIHIKVLIQLHAKLNRWLIEKFKLQDIISLKKTLTLHSLLLLKMDLFLLLLKLEENHSSSIDQELLLVMIVELHSTMLSQLLEFSEIIS